MAPDRRVLVVFEDRATREDSMRTALELAKRLRSSLSFLLLSGEVEVQQDTLAEDWVGSLARVAQAEGVEAVGAVKPGDRASALLKFLAAHEPVHVVVWAGDDAALGGGPARKHWLHRIRDKVGCPIVTAVRKHERPSKSKAVKSR